MEVKVLELVQECLVCVGGTQVSLRKDSDPKEVAREVMMKKKKKEGNGVDVFGSAALEAQLAGILLQISRAEVQFLRSRLDEMQEAVATKKPPKKQLHLEIETGTDDEGQEEVEEEEEHESKEEQEFRDSFQSSPLGMALLKRKAQQQKYSGSESSERSRNKQQENFLSYTLAVEARSSPRRNNDSATFTFETE